MPVNIGGDDYTVYINNVIPASSETSLTVERDIIDTTTISEPDPAWTYTDEHGHFHARAITGEYPTLKAITESHGCDCDEPDDVCGDEYCSAYTVTHHECVLCGERITPGTRPGQRKYTPGLMSWTLHVNGLNISLDDRVSVRIDRKNEPCMFGIAQAVGYSSESGVELLGIGKLGYRP